MQGRERLEVELGREERDDVEELSLVGMHELSHLGKIHIIPPEKILLRKVHRIIRLRVKSRMEHLGIEVLEEIFTRLLSGGHREVKVQNVLNYREKNKKSEGKFDQGAREFVSLCQIFP